MLRVIIVLIFISKSLGSFTCCKIDCDDVSLIRMVSCVLLVAWFSAGLPDFRLHNSGIIPFGSDGCVVNVNCRTYTRIATV